MGKHRSTAWAAKQCATATPPKAANVRTPQTHKRDPGEMVLPDNYPVYGDYVYICDGVVTRSPTFGTVADLKRLTGAKEIRNFILFSGRTVFIGDRIE